MARWMRIAMTLMVAVMSLTAFSEAAEAAGVATKRQATLLGSAAFPTAKVTVLYQEKNGVPQMTVQVGGAPSLAGTRVKLEQGDLLPALGEMVLGAGGKGKMTLQGAALPIIPAGTVLDLKASGGVEIASGVLP